MKRLKKMMRRIEDSMVALTFAEAGEFETAREIINRNRKILLGLRNIDVKSMQYAINICRRINADLDILWVSGEKDYNPSDAETEKKLVCELSKENIMYNIIRGKGSLREEILDYTSGRNEILFVIVGSSSEIDTDFDLRSGKISYSWEKLKCPLVVVGGGRVPVAA
ncbi:MAG: hypothetical protein AB1632_13580 [Nitrospirota bacterium]